MMNWSHRASLIELDFIFTPFKWRLRWNNSDYLKGFFIGPFGLKVWH